jgi:hypothetical protein
MLVCASGQGRAICVFVIADACIHEGNSLHLMSHIRLGHASGTFVLVPHDTRV